MNDIIYRFIVCVMPPPRHRQMNISTTTYNHTVTVTLMIAQIMTMTITTITPMMTPTPRTQRQEPAPPPRHRRATPSRPPPRPTRWAEVRRRGSVLAVLGNKHAAKGRPPWKGRPHPSSGSPEHPPGILESGVLVLFFVHGQPVRVASQ